MDTGKAVIAETSMSTHACIDPHKGFLSSGVRLGLPCVTGLECSLSSLGKGCRQETIEEKGGGGG